MTSQNDDRSAAALARHVDRATSHTVRNERYLNWLAAELRASMSTAERQHDDTLAAEFVARVRSRAHAREAAARVKQFPARVRAPGVNATVAQSLRAAAFARCAPVLDLAAAAGVGRALWDEQCESWVEVPDDVTGSRHVAIRVHGDSMLPVLRPNDLILVKLDATPANGDVVVARLDDDGYVVKRFSGNDDGSVELASLNASYAPIVAPRTQVTIMGTVIARFTTM